MYCAIQCKAKDDSGQDLFLTDSFPIVTASSKQNNNFRDNQLWMSLYSPTTGGVCLKNKESGNLIAVPQGNKAAQLIPDSVETEENLNWPSAVLNIAGTDGFCVIRGLRDQDNNLDLSGNYPYKDGVEVLFWTWESSNNDNYYWKFVPVSV